MTPAQFQRMQDAAQNEYLIKFVEKQGLTKDNVLFAFQHAAIEAYKAFQQQYVMDNELLDTNKVFLT